MNRQKISYLTGVLLAMLLGNSAKGQTATYSDVMYELAMMQSNFKTDSSNYTSCVVGYYYSKESTPTAYLDSLWGQFKLSGGSRYTRIGNTETIQNDSVVVLVYNDDSTLMAGPVSPDNLAPMAQGLFVNNLDSAFIAGNTDSVTITTLNGLKTLFFVFNDSSRYYNCKLVYDSATYIPKSLSYVLRSSKTPETGQPTGDGALITIFFLGYSHAAFDVSGLNTGKYITIGSDGKAAAQPSYSHYNFIQTSDFPVTSTD
ncbi:MAG TPA: hypothetical protein VNS58_02705 [Puia sp.]|nr:hypothetical protein [Puia sp.]